MSLKDDRFYRHCPICSDTLIGTDDGLEVYESLKEQLGSPELDNEDPCCTLCGEECTRAEAEAIIAAGEPPLLKR